MFLVVLLSPAVIWVLCGTAAVCWHYFRMTKIARANRDTSMKVSMDLYEILDFVGLGPISLLYVWFFEKQVLMLVSWTSNLKRALESSESNEGVK